MKGDKQLRIIEFYAEWPRITAMFPEIFHVYHSQTYNCIMFTYRQHKCMYYPRTGTLHVYYFKDGVAYHDMDREQLIAFLKTIKPWDQQEPALKYEEALRNADQTNH